MTIEFDTEVIEPLTQVTSEANIYNSGMVSCEQQKKENN